MFIWDAATMFVLLLGTVYFGSFAWIEIRSRRNKNKATSPNVEARQGLEDEGMGTPAQQEGSAIVKSGPARLHEPLNS